MGGCRARKRKKLFKWQTWSVTVMGKHSSMLPESKRPVLT